MGSRDFADIVTLVDGREEIIEEVRSADADLRAYLAAELRELMSESRLIDGVYAGLPPDAASQARATEVVVPRLNTIVAAVEPLTA